jgi:pyridoxine 5-phosphate synthase
MPLTTPKLSVNINKIALLRNSRGQNQPNLLEAIDLVLAAGADGITVHPRMDQRHILFSDPPLITKHLRENHPNVELNIECEDHPFLIEMVEQLKPAQCTLVPVDPGETTSSHGWDLPRQSRRLKDTVSRLQKCGVRVSIFVNPIPAMMQAAHDLGVDRIEIYTGPYADAWNTPNFSKEQTALWDTATEAARLGLGVNAGHDLDRHNLGGLTGLTALDEVSIGHAIVVRALHIGVPAAIAELKTALQ